MKTIIVPYDSSEFALNAVKFANRLAGNNDKVIVLHVKSETTLFPISTISHSTHKTYEHSIAEIDKEIKRALKWEQLPSNFSINLTHGEIMKSIGKFAEEKNADLILIGKKDKHTIIEKWLGTISLGLIGQHAKDIYVIPKAAEYQNFDKVLIASDSNISQPQLLNKIIAWNNPYQAFIKFLHVYKEHLNEFDEQSVVIVKELFEKHKVGFPFEISSIPSLEVVQSILMEAESFQADLIIIIAENKNWVHKLMNESVTKTLVYQSNIPLLFLQIDN